MTASALRAISVVTLGVADIERSERFYRDGFGLEHARPPKGVVYFKLEGALLALYPRDRLARYAGVESSPAGGFAGVTLSCNVASRSEVDALTSRAEAAGATVVRAPGVLPGAGALARWIDSPPHGNS